MTINIQLNMTAITLRAAMEHMRKNNLEPGPITVHSKDLLEILERVESQDEILHNVSAALQEWEDNESPLEEAFGLCTHITDLVGC